MIDVANSFECCDVVGGACRLNPGIVPRCRCVVDGGPSGLWTVSPALCKGQTGDLSTGRLGTVAGERADRL